LDYEKIALLCQVCFDIGHLAAQCPKGPKKSQNHRKSTWWVGSHIDNKHIFKEDSSDVDLPKEESKEAPLKSNVTPSNEDSPDMDPPLDDLKY
jgi:hypothetical protein